MPRPGAMVWTLPAGAGRRVMGWTGEAGRATLFLARGLAAVLRRPVRVRETLHHAHFIGNRSLTLIVLAAGFTGMVLVLQGYHALVRFGSESYLGSLVALSLIRELAPVLGALMVTARAGSAIAATIGSMRITEQIDALEALAVDPFQYLVAPRIVAALVTGPLLVAVFDLVGIGAGWAFAVHVLGLDGGTFMANIRDTVVWADVSAGLWKSILFSGILVWIAAYCGFHAERGARGIGVATTQAVVVTAILILAADYVATALLF